MEEVIAQLVKMNAYLSSFIGIGAIICVFLVYFLIIQIKK